MFAGSWIGAIKTGGISLRIIFNLTYHDNDSLSVTLDSPDQGARGIKIGPVIVDGKNIQIQAAMIAGIYNGVLENDTLIKGTWRQGPQSIELDLSRLKGEFRVNRPQEPKPPFPYTEREVTFLNSRQDISLAGTLTIPEGKGPFPAAVLVTGSGSQNRNEELLGHKPFLVLADHLARNGIAVLRYDDRGIGGSKGDPATATTADLATDALAAFGFLGSVPEVNIKKSGIIGHSEGGIIVAMAAAENRRIGWIISLAGTGVSGFEIIQRQLSDLNLASGMSANENELAVSENEKILKVLIEEKDNQKAHGKMYQVYSEILRDKNTSEAEKEKLLQSFSATTPQAALTWMRYFISTDPAVFWKKVRCPVLAINGMKDLQVAHEINLPAIEKAVRAGGNKKIVTMALPGLNHLFQHSTTGLPSEYGNIEETFSSEALKIISDWIKNTVR